MPSADAEQFLKEMRKCKSIIAVAGAGLSAASGIPTFRGAGGLWKTHDAMKLATPEAFTENPSRVWEFYHYRREKALKAEPNAAHFALAKLLMPEYLKSIAPEAKFTLITQNVDGLSVEAFQKSCPSRKPRMFEMHGSIFDTVCTVCGDVDFNISSPICAALGDTEDNFDSKEESNISLDDLPHCGKCKGLLRPGVVWFGEVPHNMETIGEIVDEADLALIVGTSSTVYPAAGYAYEVSENGGKVAIFNLENTDGDEDADFLFLGPCEETLPSILSGLETRNEQS